MANRNAPFSCSFGLGWTITRNAYVLHIKCCVATYRANHQIFLDEVSGRRPPMIWRVINLSLPLAPVVLAVLAYIGAAAIEHLHSGKPSQNGAQAPSHA
jgi:hypothetical protein